MRPEFVHHMFDRAAEKFGDNVAIETAQGRMTYGELQVSSNRLANFILDSGAEKGSVVALMGAEPLQFIIGIIAALKAGCAFVTLDPGAPENRLRAILLEAQPQLLLIGSRLIDRLDRLDLDSLESEPGEAVQAPRIILLDDAPAGPPSGRLVVLGGYSRHPRTASPSVIWGPDEMCYIFFTSGSSGKPKGIAGRLKAIDHFIRWEIDTLQLAERTRVSQLISPSFDAVLRDIFVPLSIGGTICVPPEPNLAMDGKALVEWLDNAAINLIHCVPSVFRLMLGQNLDPSRFSSLRHILMSGEPLLPSDINKWMDTFGDRVQLINLYGPTETTMTKFSYMVTSADRDRRSIPIGKPMEGAKALIVDPEGRPCRPGKVGEILIRTPFRALGYYNNPAATSEVFIRNPFNDDPEDILYRTGDFGRLMPDGNYEFLGRKDFQVKVRGVRVELGEIENALRGHESVEDVAVAVWDDTASNNFLCAYVVLTADVSSAALRAFLAQHLPEAMLPSAFVTMEMLPRTLSGKIDRRALPRPKHEAGSDGDLLEPRTPVEHIVAAIWTQLLGVKRAGLKDSFFESGGHSLLLTQLNSRLKQVFDVELPLQALMEGPNISHIAQLIESALRSGAAPARPALRPVSRNRHLPLSYAQERMWVVEQMAPGTAAYNLFAAVILSGRLSLPAIEQSLNQEIKRQESLRTSIDSTGGEPHQTVAEERYLGIGLVDLAGLDPAESRMLVRTLGSERSARAFDLGQAPLMSVVLLRVNPAEHAVLFAVHHIISDAWSISILIGDIGAFYRANLMGAQPQVGDLEIQYADYAAWERDWMRGEVLERELDYWKGALAGAAGLLELPADRDRPAVQAFRGARVELAVSRALAEPLNALSRREGVTLFMTLLAAFSTLLHRYTMDDDICIGTPIAARNQIELEGMIGLFANTLVLRTDLSGDPGFKRLMERTRGVCLRAYAHQEVPFERLVQELNIPRDPSYTPLYQVMLAFENNPKQALDLPGLTVRGAEIEQGRARCDLVLGLTGGGQGLDGVIDYDPDLFDRPTIERLRGHYLQLLGAISVDPRMRLSEMPLLTPAERSQLAVELNDTAAALPEKTIHSLFEEQASSAPDAIVLDADGSQLSYGVLDEHAGRLAARLLRYGAGPDLRVGLCTESSSEMIVGMLAILKAGSCYVPISPSYPDQRIALLLSDSAASILLAAPEAVDRLRAFDAASGARIVPIEPLSLSAGTDTCCSATVTAESLAYLLYTSGSTGQPKGVMISHRMVCNMLGWRLRTFSVDNTDVILQNISFTFDPSVWQIFGALLSGARLVLPGPSVTPAVAHAVAYLSDQIRTRRVTITDFAPSVLQAVLDELDMRGPDGLECLRIVFSGAEALSGELRDRFMSRLPAALFNQYGPTEAAVDSTFARADSDFAARVPIGRPISNKQVYILDPYLQPVPIAVRAEIYVGGEGLAHGYTGQPDTTAERFVPDLFSKAAGRRLYRTGDLGRCLADGRIEFQGRTDHQVKVRGIRVELGEIEKALGMHPALREVAVVAAPGESGCRLIAYGSPNNGDAPMPEELYSFLQRRLPEYMIPSGFVLMEALPRTPGGKVDRPSLPDPAAALSLTRSFVAPRTELEASVAGVWADVLGVQPVGVHDNFFRLGGHSLLASRLLARLSAMFGIDLTMVNLFAAPTVARLSESIDELLFEKLEELTDEEAASLI